MIILCNLDHNKYNSSETFFIFTATKSYGKLLDSLNF